MRREERFVSDSWFFFLLDELLTDGARGCDLVAGCVSLVWKGMGIAYKYPRPIEKEMSKQPKGSFLASSTPTCTPELERLLAHHIHKLWRERVAYIRICSLIHFSERWLRRLFIHS